MIRPEDYRYQFWALRTAVCEYCGKTEVYLAGTLPEGWRHWCMSRWGDLYDEYSRALWCSDECSAHVYKFIRHGEGVIGVIE